MSIGDEFRGLPIEELVGAPLIAAATAQGKLAMLTNNFIETVGMSNGIVKSVDFKYNSIDPSGIIHNQTLSVPLLSIINVPNLSVKKATVDFTMEVKQQYIDKSSRLGTITSEAELKSWYSPITAKISGTVTTRNENTRNSDKSAKYHITVEARDDGLPEGLAKVLDKLNCSAINSSPAQTTAQPTAQPASLPPAPIADPPPST